MTYKVTWSFGEEEIETEYFESRGLALQEAAARASTYSRQYGRCETKVLDAEGQIILDHTDIFCA